MIRTRKRNTLSWLEMITDPFVLGFPEYLFNIVAAHLNLGQTLCWVASGRAHRKTPPKSPISWAPIRPSTHSLLSKRGWASTLQAYCTHVCSSDTWRPFQPQGLCTCFPRCLEYPSSCSHSSFFWSFFLSFIPLCRNLFWPSYPCLSPTLAMNSCH